ncbi:hypothetical protein QBC46DRAFT_365702 [Diplogelasinospora grovesii]|uniref:Uncharacterized protein n=1 Tax=Diplogelasinospora grovesii TaxID=303347 RepID=A0AAN6N3Y5_9PEZI|nr:hypothetical protein QBC46DRAFT_365702 [Diplogelasinospora grovesii]
MAVGSNRSTIRWVFVNRLLPATTVPRREIWDKSKTDTLARILTLLQAGWLIIQLLGRAILHLPTSTLELSAGAIVFCTLGTFICWLHKPSDVNTCTVLTTEATTQQILLEAGEAAASPYRHTPLDFVAKQSPTCGYDRLDNRERPLRRFPNDRFPDIGTAEKSALFCMTSAYAAFHLIGRYFTFPTRLELMLWRISSSLVTATTVFSWVFETVAARHRFGRWDKYLIWMCLQEPHQELAAGADPEVGVKRTDTLHKLDAFEQEQQKAKPILIWEVGLILPIVFLYAAARGYMIVEVFVSLRELPLEAYTTFLRICFHIVRPLAAVID